QVDPWAGVLADFGVEVETGNVVYEWMPKTRSSPDSSVLNWQAIDSYPAVEEQILAGAMRGKRLFLNHPTPVRIEPSPGVDVGVVASIEPSVLRFVENDWRGDGARIRRLPEDKRFTEPVPAVVAIQRDDQRILVVGSGGWMLSGIVNESGSLGGERLVLANPGNRELALSGVAWLAGMDDLVATAASGREVSRFSALSGRSRLAWMVILPLVLGFGPLIVGGAITAARRNAT
ncbi:MAG: hypothetical protein MK085_08395, partial [Phycisphaerales bacterium]|nr:hypothetical protein [Phycisphaerales bacterium]